MKYDDILNLGFEYRDAKKSVRMLGTVCPMSLTEKEFDWIGALIEKYKCKSAFELATAFGMSTSAIALGMKKTGGRVVTMDAFIEERTQCPGKYRDVGRIITDPSYAPVGLKVGRMLWEHFGVSDIVEPNIGWSPDDVPAVIKDRKFDFVFIDAGHFDNFLERDFTAIFPYMTENAVLVIHDTHLFDKKLLSSIGDRMNSDITPTGIPELEGFYTQYYVRNSRTKP